jgi:transposase
MAGKVKPMSQIKQLLQLHKKGESKKQIARCLGISKNTVKSYLQKLYQLKAGIDDLLLLEDPELEKKFHEGNPAYKGSRFEHLKGRIDSFEKELKEVGVNKRLLWEEYRMSYPDGYGYTQFCHHLNQQIIARKPTMVLIHKPGEKLFVDFAGKMLSYIDPKTGEIIKCPVFVACLPYSDYCFTIAVPSQKVEDFIFALVCCLKFLGGSPEILVTDNLKAAVIKANRYDPDINQALEDCCNHYGITILPTRVVSPKDKALVENQVKLVYSRIFARLRKQTFFSLQALNQAISEKNKCHNQTRMQKKPFCREENFLANEKPLLKPLPDEPFELKYYANYKVAKNNHIHLTKDLHYYSVPYQYTGEQTKVIYTNTLVRIYVRGTLVAVHPRNKSQGGYSTIKEHLCSHHRYYLDRSPGYYMNKAKSMTEDLFQLIKLLFEGGRPPEQNYRTCEGIFSLYRKTDPDIFIRACQEAISCQCYSYRFLRKVIDNFKNDIPEQQNEPRPLPDHQNIRGKEYYKQLNINF